MVGEVGERKGTQSYAVITSRDHTDSIIVAHIKRNRRSETTLKLLTANYCERRIGTGAISI